MGMTREEAKKEIEKVFVPEYANYIITALTEGETVSDKALKQETCKDAISRQEVIGGINEYFHDEYYQRTSIQDCRDCLIEDVIKPLSPVQPKIIRCGQCKYAEVADKEDAQDGYTCQFHRGSVWFSGSYCSWAERRTDE